MWGLNVGLPEKITSMGGKFLWNDYKETPEFFHQFTTIRRKKKIIQFEVRPWMTNVEDGVGMGISSMEVKAHGGPYDKSKSFLAKDKKPRPPHNWEGWRSLP